MKIKVSLLAKSAAALLLSWTLGSVVPARATTIDINIGARPHVVAIPGSNVYYVNDYATGDVYRIGSTWYVYQDNTWYRAYTTNGPWTYVEYRRVPRQIVTVPTGYYHFEHRQYMENVPPGQWKKDHGRKWARKHGHGNYD